MLKILRLIFFSNLFVFSQVNAQVLRLTQIRVGFDPVFTATQLLPGVTIKKNYFKYRNWEANIEFIGPYRISVLGEVGQTDMSMLLYNGTVTYNSDGFYTRLGMNFDLSRPNKNYEYDLGWRLCTSSFTETATTNLKGIYWGESARQGIFDGGADKRYSSAFWAEILFESKHRIFPSSESIFRNFWFGYSVRVKISPFSNSQTIGSVSNQYIPGFGISNSVMGGLQFNLIYAFHLLGKEVHKGKHLHDNFDIIEKDHHIYKIKKHKDTSGDIERD